MKKTTLSIWFIGASLVYALYVNMKGTTPERALHNLLSQPEEQIAVSSGSQLLETTNTPVSTLPSSLPASEPAKPAAPTLSSQHGKYKDGTYRGDPVDAYYGTVQVEAVIKNGVITNVTFLQYPNDRSTSRYINSQAMPLLQREAIQAQNAHVNIVSGATDTSMAFQQSLESALQPATI
ncbi:MAG: FMN-binding protein [Patescibacteria group bacterium]|nr:FMN-binding protein [Patescibacteria group bacterium]MDE2437940.1 FMN-binding protein [Patescibacteria group bacterium]